MLELENKCIFMYAIFALSAMRSCFCHHACIKLQWFNRNLSRELVFPKEGLMLSWPQRCFDGCRHLRAIRLRTRCPGPPDFSTPDWNECARHWHGVPTLEGGRTVGSWADVSLAAVSSGQFLPRWIFEIDLVNLQASCPHLRHHVRNLRPNKWGQ